MVARASGAAQRRKLRRLRAALRHEQQYHSADKTTRAQHNAPRGQKNAGTEYYALSDEDEVPARSSRPPCLGEPRGPQDKVQQRTMEQIADDVPMLTLLDSPVPQMVDQLVAVLARYDLPLADQVIEVPKVSCPARCGRTVLCTPQTAEQLVEVPTILSPSFLRMLQNIDTPVPGRGVQRGLRGFSHERSSTVFGDADHRFPAATAEQNVDIPVPGGSLHGLSVSGSSSSSAVSRDVRGEGSFSHFSPG